MSTRGASDDAGERRWFRLRREQRDGAPDGVKLVSLAERVRMLGGELAITSGPGNGTHLALTLPAGESHAP